MYSMVMMMAVAGSGDSVAFGHKSHGGCGCSGAAVVSCAPVSCAPVASCGCDGGHARHGHHHMRGHSCGGCYSTPACYTAPSCGCSGMNYAPVSQGWGGCAPVASWGCSGGSNWAAPMAPMAPPAAGVSPMPATRSTEKTTDKEKMDKK